MAIDLEAGRYYVAKPLDPDPESAYYKLEGPYDGDQEAEDHIGHHKDMVVRVVGEEKEPQPPEEPPPPPPPEPPS